MSDPINSKFPKPKIAVLMATFNGVQWLPEQIQSILEQRGVETTIFVSDDHSTDGTFEWLSLLMQTQSCVKLLPRRDGPPSVGANFCHLIKSAPWENFDAVAFADQDDIWFPDKLARQFELLNSKDVVGVSGSVTALWSSGRQVYISKAEKQRKFDYLFESSGPGCTFLMRTTFVLQIKQFFTKHLTETSVFAHHDWLIYAMARSLGHQWYIDARSTLFYRQHRHNHLGVNSGLFAALKRLGMVVKGDYKKEVAQLIAMCRVCAPERHIEFDQLLRLVKNTGVRSHLARMVMLPKFRRTQRDRFALGLIFLLGLW